MKLLIHSRTVSTYTLFGMLLLATLVAGVYPKRYKMWPITQMSVIKRPLQEDGGG